MKTLRSLHVAAAMLVLAVGTVAGAEPPLPSAPGGKSVADIQACMRANLVKRAALRDLSITATDRENKTHSLRVKLYWKPSRSNEMRVNLRLVEPPAVAGSSYLLLEKGKTEEVYFYLPGTDRGVRLDGDRMDEPMWNTDFSYAEMKHVLGLIAAGTTARAADTVVHGRPAWVLQTLTNVNDDGGAYTRVDSAIDQATCTLQRSEFYAKGTTLAKVLEAESGTTMTVDTYSVVLGYTMRDVRKGSKTVVNLSDFTLMERVSETLFEPDRFFEPAE